LNKALLKPEVQEFIFSYTEDSSKLAFAGSPFSDIATSELIQQIESRRAIEKKLPHWFNTKNIYYPPKLHLEQTSSEPTAAYKARLVVGTTIADLTGGFGIDTFYFAEMFDTVYHYETNQALSDIANHNFKTLGRMNVHYRAEDGLQAIKESFYDVIYIDPSRRNKDKGKVFFLNDCEPNVPQHLDYLLERCHTMLLKTSPMLDISVGLNELKHVAEIHVVAVNNEVKELLWKLQKDVGSPVVIKTINLTSAPDETFSFQLDKYPEIVYSNPSRFLYEPNAAILKAGGFQHISEAFKLKKLHKHSHLFTSESLREFPGRRFSINKIVPYNKKHMRGITFAKANITTRNFPESVATLRKKWKIQDGGNIYLFFTTLENEDKIMLICEKV
jgi:PG_1098 ferredoxin-like domain/THUMP domain-like